MNCREFREFVDAVPLRERGREALRRIQAHAGACEDCAAYLAEQRGMDRELMRLPEPAGLSDFSMRVMARVRQVKADRPVAVEKPRLAAAQVAVLAGCLIVGVGGGLYWFGIDALRQHLRVWLSEFITAVGGLPASIQPGSVVQRLHDLPERATGAVRGLVEGFSLEAIWGGLSSLSGEMTLGSLDGALAFLPSLTTLLVVVIGVLLIVGFRWYDEHDGARIRHRADR
ncbi:MAG: hypothetical protein JXQ75_05280 [Phycisphaerae bacterium]|nr:hypothetical protein [Phycisphaerae bacterium]